MSVKNRRKTRIVIEKDFQYRFSLKLCIVLGIVSFFFAGITIFFVQTSYETLIDNALLQMPGIVQQLKRESRHIISIIIASYISLMILLFFASLYLTSKIAGPIYSLKLRLQEFASGQSNVRIRFRKGDELHNLADVFNKAMEANERRQKKREAPSMELPS